MQGIQNRRYTDKDAVITLLLCPRMQNDVWAECLKRLEEQEEKGPTIEQEVRQVIANLIAKLREMKPDETVQYAGGWPIGKL